jgi:hypothetical protein
MLRKQRYKISGCVKFLYVIGHMVLHVKFYTNNIHSPLSDCV